MRTLSVIIFLFLFLGPCPANATTYHVELTGDDANSGLARSPWRTLAKACDTVATDEGHIIQVGEGTFTEAGMLVWVQPVGAAPGESFPDATEVYGVGAFLAAGAELFRLTSGK